MNISLCSSLRNWLVGRKMFVLLKYKPVKSVWTTKHLWSFVVVQWLSHVQLCDPMDYSMPGFPVLHSLPELAQTRVHWVGDAIQTSHPLSSPYPLAFDLASIRFFSNESGLHIRWPEYWSFSFSICPAIEFSGLISFRIDWFHLHVVQRTLQSLLQHQFEGVDSLALCLLYSPALNNSAWPLGRPFLDYTDLRQQSDVSLFNTLSRFVIAFLLNSNHLLISRLQSPSTEILEPKKTKSVTTSTFSLLVCHEAMGPDTMIFVL